MDDLISAFALLVVLSAVLALIVYVVSKVVEHRNPPIGKFLELDGTKLHYLERGSGPSVVFLHGNATMLQDFCLSEAFASAAHQRRAIAFDRPGFGYSTRPRGRTWTASDQADVLAAALRILNCGPATIVGHSWGTLVALAMAERHPDLTRSLVLLSGYYYARPRFDVGLAALGALPVIGDILRYTVTPLFGLLMLPGALRAMFAPCETPEGFLHNFPRLMMLRPWQLRATLQDGAMMLQIAATLQPRYRSLQMPTFISAGDGDRLIDPWHSEKLHQEIHASHLKILPGIGHMVQHSAASQVADIVAQATGAHR